MTPAGERVSRHALRLPSVADSVAMLAAGWCPSPMRLGWWWDASGRAASAADAVWWERALRAARRAA